MNTNQLISDLGGGAFIAGNLGLTRQAVTQWKKRGLPNSIKTRVALLNLARSQGVEVDESALMGIDIGSQQKPNQ